jgi:type I restriction enzyme S subunit
MLTLNIGIVVVKKAEPRLMLSDKIIRLDVSRLMNREFLNMCNNAEHARRHYAANASGTSSSMKNVSREVVLATPIPLPPLAEQSRIVTRVNELRSLCADLRQRLAALQSGQKQLAQALIENASS